MIGLEGSSKADETDTDKSSNTAVTFSVNYPADHEKEAVFVSDVTKYYYKVKAVGKNALKADFETGLSSAVKVKAK